MRLLLKIKHKQALGTWRSGWIECNMVLGGNVAFGLYAYTDSDV